MPHPPEVEPVPPQGRPQDHPLEDSDHPVELTQLVLRLDFGMDHLEEVMVGMDIWEIDDFRDVIRLSQRIPKRIG